MSGHPLYILATHLCPHCIEIVLIKTPDLWPPLYNGRNLWSQWWPLYRGFTIVVLWFSKVHGYCTLEKSEEFHYATLRVTTHMPKKRHKPDIESFPYHKCYALLCSYWVRDF